MPYRLNNRRFQHTIRFVAALLLSGATLSAHPPLPANALTVNSISLAGGTGTLSQAGMLYAKASAPITLSLSTTSDARCVQLSGDHTAVITNSAGSNSWTFPLNATSGDGAKVITTVVKAKTDCTIAATLPVTRVVTYTSDSTSPALTPTLSPAPNAQGWNNSDVTVSWSAKDAGVGVNTSTLPATQIITTNTAGLAVVASVADKLNNQSTATVTVKLDNLAPAIHVAPSPLPNAAGWNNTDVTVQFTCEDAPSGGSGIASCSGTTVLTETTATGAWVSGAATDNAGNSASAATGPIFIDKDKPALSGAPVESPNVAGWYTADVVIHWSCSDALSGIAGDCPADSIISGEGIDLTDIATVSDIAGNTTTAISVPLVKIDRTPPNTTASADSAWHKDHVIVQLNASDNLAGVAATFYALDGNAPQAGTALTIEVEGMHTLHFWSEDHAGNIEPLRSVQIQLDLSAPSITHLLSPLPNVAGWNNSAVTVTFECSDALSGLASCTSAQTVSDEGKNIVVKGAAADNAGNIASDDALISMDKTAPQITATLSQQPNAQGWHNAPVIVSFECSDDLSGIVECSASQTLSDGRDQSATGNATDAAGNSASAALAGIHIDMQAPALSGTLVSTPNAQGWLNGDASVAWSCEDDSSGVDGACPTNSIVAGEGDDLSASASIRDNAGNSVNKTLAGIKIDRTPPATQANVPTTPGGWHADSVQIALNALDNLSGVAATFYTIDGGAPQPYAGAFVFSQAGEHTLTFWSIDDAGNIEDASSPGHTITLKIDADAPVITGARNPLPNAQGWNNAPVTVSFECSDAESGIASCSDNTVVSSEGAGQIITGTAQDNAGHIATRAVGPINIDLTPPAITGTATTAAGAEGWHTAPVTIHFTCDDALSGIAICPSDVTLRTNGAGQSVQGVAMDNAGNIATDTVSGININTPPVTLRVSGIADGRIYVLGAVPAGSCVALAGGVEVAPCKLDIAGGSANGVGTFNYTATAQLDDGTRLTQAGGYRVIYRFDGFLQPMNDTARAICAACSESIFKTGSTVPVKFQLKRADGTCVMANQAPAWLTPLKGAPVTASIDEGMYSDAASSGAFYRWDAGAQQYLYNWSTKGASAGYRYRIGVALDDGQTYYITLGLR